MLVHLWYSQFLYRLSIFKLLKHRMKDVISHNVSQEIYFVLINLFDTFVISKFLLYNVTEQEKRPFPYLV